MARGWESKSIESQQEEQQAKSRESEGDRARLERNRQRESIESSLRGLRRELENARSAVHRAALENAVRHLESQLKDLQ